MLIKRTERERQRGSLAAFANESNGRLDRRAFLRRSGLAAGGLATLGALPLASVRKAKAGPPPAPGAAVTIHKNICTHCAVGCTVTAEVSNGVWIGQEPSWDSPINRGSHCAKGASVRELVHSDRRLKYPMKLANGQWTRVSNGIPSDQRDWRQDGGDSPEVRAGVGLLDGLGEILQRRRLSLPQDCGVLGHQQSTTIRPASAIPPPSPAWPIPGATAR